MRIEEDADNLFVLIKTMIGLQREVPPESKSRAETQIDTLQERLLVYRKSETRLQTILSRTFETKEERNRAIIRWSRWVSRLGDRSEIRYFPSLCLGKRLIKNGS